MVIYGLTPVQEKISVPFSLSYPKNPDFKIFFSKFERRFIGVRSTWKQTLTT